MLQNRKYYISFFLFMSILLQSNEVLGQVHPTSSQNTNKMTIENSGERGNVVEVRLPRKDGSLDTIQGLLLPFSQSKYEHEQSLKFQGD